jgi:phosphoribosylformylglycinamidine cyclo-ligase
VIAPAQPESAPEPVTSVVGAAQGQAGGVIAGSYSGAGVDIDAGDRAVQLIRGSVGTTARPEVIGDLGGFAGLFDASALRDYRRPLLATSTDGVGTKVAIAQRADRHDTIGLDLVAMVLDDLVVCGAEPLFMTDYIACGKVVPERIAAIVAGIAEGCRIAGAALLGGETAEHPGLMGPDEYDLAGAGTGVVEADAMLGPERVRAGDVVVAMAASGLHANGYSLVRHVFFTQLGWSLDREVPELGRSLGDVLLEPTRIYASDCLSLASDLGVDLHALAHVTGGGFAANLDRVLPASLLARIDWNSWEPEPIFGLVGGVGGVPLEELRRTLNMGVGMAAVVAEARVDRAVEALARRGVPAWAAGTIGRAE